MRRDPEILDTQIVAQSRFFAVEQVRLRFGNGEERLYERLREWDARSVVIVAFRPPEDILLVREYACGIDQHSLALPKGMIEPGETTLQAANRELQEEAGFGAHHIQELGVLTLAPGHLCHRITVVLAESLYEQKLAGDEPELPEVVPVQLSEFDDLVRRGLINEARTIAAIYMAKNQLERAATPPDATSVYRFRNVVAPAPPVAEHKKRA
ncbi:MAG: ADP compounds hydrolase NudE [Aquisalimonadaceae bacterium]